MEALSVHLYCSVKAEGVHASDSSKLSAIGVQIPRRSGLDPIGSCDAFSGTSSVQIQPWILFRMTPQNRQTTLGDPSTSVMKPSFVIVISLDPPRVRLDPSFQVFLDPPPARLQPSVHIFLDPTRVVLPLRRVSVVSPHAEGRAVPRLAEPARGCDEAPRPQR